MPRRLLTSLVSAVVLVALLAGCGDDGTASDSTASDTTASDTTASDSAAAAEDEFLIVVEHKYGTTEITEQPERVVTAGFNDSDYALAFGYVPVAVRDFVGSFEEESRPWAQDALDGEDPPKISDAEAVLNYEAIAAAQPDLILAYSFVAEEEYDLLSAIAPTIIEPEDGSLWPEHTRDVGRALGMSDRAEELVAEVEAEFDAAIAENPEFAGMTMAIQWATDPEQFYLLPAEDPRSGLFTSLGFVMPETTGEISPERVDLLDQDVLVVVGLDEDGYASNELFQGLDAVKEGRVVYLGGFETEFAGALGFDSPLSLPYAIDILVPELAAALSS